MGGVFRVCHDNGQNSLYDRNRIGKIIPVSFACSATVSRRGKKAGKCANVQKRDRNQKCKNCDRLRTKGARRKPFCAWHKVNSQYFQAFFGSRHMDTRFPHRCAAVNEMPRVFIQRKKNIFPDVFL